jgi:hypothetical protein
MRITEMTKVVRENGLCEVTELKTWSGGTGGVEDKTYAIDDPTPHDDWNNLTATIRLFTYRSKHDPNVVMMEFTRRVWVPMAVVTDLQALHDDQAVSQQEKDDAIDTLVQVYRLRNDEITIKH